MGTLQLVENSRAGLGLWLRREREARGLTLAAVASDTKIPSWHLEALERGDVPAVPPFYQRAEVRAVARAVGLDPQQAVARLDAILVAVEPPPRPVLPPEPTPRVRSEYVLAAGMVVLVAWMLGWGPFARGESSGRPALAEQPAPDLPADAASPQAAEPLLASAAALPQAPAAFTPPRPAVDDVAPVPTSAELVIRTQPAGAHVTVDGIGWGVSPVTIRHIEPGDKRIRATMDGYAAAEQSVAVDDGTREAVTLRLEEFRTP